ncbi:MAG: hypothetical protein U0414_34715 [Polyangiaceae bacterium]
MIDRPMGNEINGRASKRAIMKRRAARQFNDMLLGSTTSALDGRTAKRRARILAELKAGASRAAKKPLKPIDVLLRVQSLIDLGEPLASIKKAIGTVKSAPRTAELEQGLRSLHEAYGFSPDAYAFVGIDEATLRRAGIRGPAPRKGASGAGATRPLHKTTPQKASLRRASLPKTARPRSASAGRAA